MCPVNVSPEYAHAEKAYMAAETMEERIEKLKGMISVMPGHKGAENLRAQLRNRLKRYKEQLEKSKKSGKGSRVGIKKEDLQVVIIGNTNTGKSTLLDLLTNAEPKISQFQFTTIHPIIGMMNYETINMQIIENPSIDSDYYDKGLTNSADTLLILVDNLEHIKEIEPFLKKSPSKKIIVFSKADTLSENEKRKIKATLKSKFKKYEAVLISSKKKEGIPELKNKIFQSFEKIRIYTKEPNKKESSKKPIIMKKNSTVYHVAEKILKGFSKNVKQTKIWGPSSKFSGQIVGLKHKLKDMDIVEFRTK
jgi:ribosome-interacting GTPase 1